MSLLSIVFLAIAAALAIWVAGTKHNSEVWTKGAKIAALTSVLSAAIAAANLLFSHQPAEGSDNDSISWVWHSRVQIVKNYKTSSTDVTEPPKLPDAEGRYESNVGCLLRNFEGKTISYDAIRISIDRGGAVSGMAHYRTYSFRGNTSRNIQITGTLSDPSLERQPGFSPEQAFKADLRFDDGTRSTSHPAIFMAGRFILSVENGDFNGIVTLYKY